MKKRIKKILRRLVYGMKADNQAFINGLRKKGIKIGDNVKFYDPQSCTIDATRPYILEIGNNVHITTGVTILTHGYDWAVMHGKYGSILGSAGRVKIGNNVFIGVYTTILKGVTIADNVIIGANSLVNKDLLVEGVYAGNPAKFIMSLDDYKAKREALQLDEAYMLYESYRNNGTEPEMIVFREFFRLFCDSKTAAAFPEFKNVMDLNNNYEQTAQELDSNDRPFKDYNEFTEYCKKRYSAKK